MDGYCEVTNKYYPSIDFHHSIPREYGGENSQLVKLGPDIHQTIHRSVTNLKVREKFLNSLPPQSRAKAELLIHLIEVAQENFNRTSSNDNVDKDVTIKNIVVSGLLYRRLVAMSKELSVTVPNLVVQILNNTIRCI